MMRAASRVAGRGACLSLLVIGLVRLATADTITISGVIAQSTSDGTGPAANNPSLNNILDGDLYAITLGFAGSITSPGTYSLASPTLLFSDSSAAASESSFDSVSLSVTADGSSYDLSLLGCLTTGSGCLLGNELDLNFSIPIAGLNSQNVTAQAISGIQPLDLLEDDGVTDIHGSVSQYSYTGQAAAVPEPGSGWLVGLSLGAAAAVGRRRKQRRKAN